MIDPKRSAKADDLMAVQVFDRGMTEADSRILGSIHNAGYDCEVKNALKCVHDSICDLNYELWSTKHALVQEAKEGMQ